MIKYAYKTVRFILYPVIFLADFLQNTFTKTFTPMNLGPVSSPVYAHNIKKNFKKNDYVLDFGCGAGFFSVVFDKKNYLGVEINKNFVDTAKQKYKKYNFKVLNENCLNGYKNKITAVFINNVIHHLSDQQINAMFVFFKKKLSKKIKFFIIEPEFPHTFFSLQFFMKALDIGNNIKTKNEYLKIFKKYLLIKSCKIKKVGIGHAVYVNGVIK